MNNRRDFLKQLSGGAAGLLVAGAGLATGVKHKPMEMHPPVLLDPSTLHGPSRFPEAIVEDSHGRKRKLYADLVKGKVVLINYMAIDNEQAFPVTSSLLEILRRLGDKMASRIHVISITSDPLHDTPARLRAFAKRMGISQRWDFVRLTGQDSAVVSARLNRHAHRPNPRAGLDVIHYGNEPVGLWGVFPVGINPDDAAMRVARVLPGGGVEGSIRRAGPRKLAQAGQPFNHRIA